MTSKSTSTVYSTGLFHGLPTFPSHDGKKYTAIVTGATGISGSEIVSVLAAAPERWETVYTLSRRPLKNENPKVKSIAADIMKEPKELGELFVREGIEADYVFFTSYMQPPTKEGQGLWTNSDELEAVNVTLLSNFLEALSISKIIPKRFLLQTGAKHYGLHLGPATIPMTEDTPALRVPHANFYFPQEDLLSSWATKHDTHWTVTRPAFIIGASPTAQINLTYPLAIYSSIQKHLRQPLSFPSDVAAWDILKDLSTAKLIGYFSEWAVLTDGAANEALNIVDDSPFAWGKFWPQIAEWYGIEHGIPENVSSRLTSVVLPRNPPPRGFGEPGKLQFKFTFEQWAARKEVKEAWVELQTEAGLRKDLDPWQSRAKLMEVFATLDAELLGGWARVQSMDKAKKLGWFGYVKSEEGIRDTLDRMVELKMVPPF